MADVKSLNEFYQKLKDNGLRLGYQFQIDIEKLADLQFFASTSSLPGRTINITEVPFFGVNFRTPTTTDYLGEWTVTVRADNALEIHKNVKDWMNEISDLSKNGGGNKNIPSSNIRVDMLDSDLTTINETIILDGAFPTNVTEISLDHAATDVATFDITFTFQYWYYEKEGNPL